MARSYVMCSHLGWFGGKGGSVELRFFSFLSHQNAIRREELLVVCEDLVCALHIRVQSLSRIIYFRPNRKSTCRTQAAQKPPRRRRRNLRVDERAGRSGRWAIDVRRTLTSSNHNAPCASVPGARQSTQRPLILPIHTHPTGMNEVTPENSNCCWGCSFYASPCCTCTEKQAKLTASAGGSGAGHIQAPSRVLYTYTCDSRLLMFRISYTFNLRVKNIPLKEFPASLCSVCAHTAKSP